MPGNVAGGVSPRKLAAGQVPNQVDDILSSSTTLLQSGGGAYTRMVDALQSLDQTENIVFLAGNNANLQQQITTLQGDVTTLQSQMTAVQNELSNQSGQIATLQINMNSVLNTQIPNLQNQINTINARLAAAGIP